MGQACEEREKGGGGGRKRTTDNSAAESTCNSARARAPTTGATSLSWRCVAAMWCVRCGTVKRGKGGGGGGGNDGRQQRGSEHLQLAACTHACHRGIEPQLAMCGGNVVRAVWDGKEREGGGGGEGNDVRQQRAAASTYKSPRARTPATGATKLSWRYVG